MSGLHLHTSNRLECLADALAEVLATPLASPLTSETVVVQSKGMERWLSLELAGRRGIWANYRFPFPTALVRELLAAVLGDAAESPLLLPEHLGWRLLQDLPPLLERPAFAPLTPYLSIEEGDDLRLWQLCGRIADTFDQYLVYRHDLIRAWEDGRTVGLGPHEEWQSELWRLVSAAAAGPHRARLVEAFIARIAQGPLLAGTRLPERLSLFGVTTLPPLHLEVFAAIAPFTDVHLFLLNPCRGYWFDLKSPGEESRLLRRAESQGVAAEDLWLASGHPLLASLGRSGRNLFTRLFELAVVSHEVFAPARGGTLLTRLQREILDGDVWPPAERQPLTAADPSLTFHSCYGPLREVEALYDLLLAAFTEIDGLTPRDVLVMAPDIEVYAPLIDAVFGSEVDGRRLIPYAVSDRSGLRQDHPARAFERLCALPSGRCGAAAVLDLLELEPVARRFDLAGDDLATIRDWVEELHIHWGLDATDRCAAGGDDASFTWRAGLDRLLLGVALPNEGRLFGGILPTGGGDGNSQRLLGSLADFIARLGDWCDATRTPRPLAEWTLRLEQLLDDFLDPGADPSALLQLRRLCATLAAEGSAAGFSAPVDFTVVRARLASLLGERSSHGFLSGPVTFCTLQPMRSVPFRVIALLGLNDGDFPRQSRPPGFDLMPLAPRPCDPSRRDEDRYLFLEALLSARERLIITWQGRHPRNAGEIPPSVVVGELLDALEQSCLPAADRSVRDELIVHHRLQPFSPDYFRAGGEVRSFQALWYAGVVAARARSASEPAFSPQPLPPPEPPLTDVDLLQLERFLRHPAEFFLRHRLQLRLPEGDEGVSEREPFRLDPLAGYQLGQGLTAELLAGGETVERRAVAAAAGELPVGPVGDGVWRSLAAEAGVFVAQLRPYLPPAGEGEEFELDLGDLRLTGRLPLPGPHGRLVWRFAKLKAKDRLVGWVRHLAACAASTPTPTVLVGRDGSLRYAPLTADAARQELRQLLDLYRRGWCEPLPFFPESSLAYAAELAKGRGDAAALQAARKVWQTSPYSSGEGDDPSLRLACGRDPFDQRFAELAQQVYGPLLAATTEG